MFLSTFPPPDPVTDKHLAMECAANECVASLELIADHIRPTAPALVAQVDAIRAIVKRLPSSEQSLHPGRRLTAVVESNFQDIAETIGTLVEHIHAADFTATARTLARVRQIALSLSLLLQVEPN